jgi:hypothetical protein
VQPLQPSPARLRSRRRSRRSRLILALTASAFALLVSVAASHLHLAPDNDEACAVCAAFAGKIEGPSAYVPTLAVAKVIRVAVATPVLRLAPPAAAHLWPPNCGPPQHV